MISSMVRELLRPTVSIALSLVGVLVVLLASRVDEPFAQAVAVDLGVTLAAFGWFARLGHVQARWIIPVLLVLTLLSWVAAYGFRDDPYRSSVGLTVGLVALTFALVDLWLGTLLRHLGDIGERERHSTFSFWEAIATGMGDWHWVRTDKVPPAELGLQELASAGWAVSAHSNASWKEIVLERPGFVISAVRSGRRSWLVGRRGQDFLTDFECRVILGRRDARALVRRLADLPVISEDAAG